MNPINVVELKASEGKKPTLPPVLQTIRHDARKQLGALAQGLFDNVDDALFELADRSQSDRHQELYFDSMRTIRIHRKELAAGFLRRANNNFYTLFEPVSTSVESIEPDDDPDYALVEQDDLEISVAVAGIVSKVTSRFSLQIMQLTKRLDHLTPNREVTERTNPLGPGMLSTAFADALEEIDLNIRVRIILMKLFERFVMESMGPVYEHANTYLIKNDILPDLKNKRYAPGRTAPRRSGPAAESGLAATQAGDSQPSEHRIGNVQGSGAPLAASGHSESLGFDTIQSLLAHARTSGGTRGTNLPNVAISSAPVGEGLPPLAHDQILAALSQLQQEVRSESFDASHLPVTTDLRSLILTQQGAGTVSGSLGQADDDTVNFVGMLFDYILNDRNLAIPMKALIGRLQIPIVKLAILDKSFFEKSAHPARVLLNELSSAGIGWSSAKELKRDALYDKIEAIVVNVLNDFASEPDVFNRQLEELRAFVNTDKKRSILVEQRVKESEKGKAQTNEAKLAVQKLINQKASGLRLPREAGRFISETWSRVLTLRRVKGGEASDAWMQGSATLDDLLWVIQPLSETDAIDRRESLVEPMIEQIRDGMNELGAAEGKISEFTQWLRQHLKILSENDRAYLADDAPVHVEHVELEPVQEIVLTPVDLLTDDNIPSIAPEFVEELKSITEGTWLEFNEPDEGLVRCKLATITQPGSVYIFVNRRGMKVLEKNRMEVATCLKDGIVKLIDESQVFDRALQSVIGNLRQLHRNNN